MFKVGDKVRVKSDLKVNQRYNEYCFTPKMKFCKGKTGTIVSVYCDSYETRGYKLDINDVYYFSNDMLEPILSYKIGDEVRIVDEMPKYLYGIGERTWLKILGKPGKIVQANADHDSYSVFISEIRTSLWFPSKCFKKESTLTSENSTENVSKSIEYIPEIEISYCEKQIYTI